MVRLIKYLLAGLAVYYVIDQLYVNWQNVQQYSWDPNYGLLVVSVAAHVLTFVVFSVSWSILLKGFGHSLKVREAFKIAYLASLGRYIPGKIWSVVALSYLGRGAKIKEEVSVAAWLVALIISLPGSFLVAIACVSLYPDLMRWQGVVSLSSNTVYVIAIVASLVSAWLLIWPNSSLKVYNILVKMLGRKQVTFYLSAPRIVAVYIGYALSWVAYGISFWLFVRALVPDIELPLTAAIGIFVLAYQIGYLAVFAPGGLGVRELVLTALLGLYFGPLAVAVAATARLWNVVGEVIASIIAWRIRIQGRE